jgi:hypothetical protein
VAFRNNIVDGDNFYQTEDARLKGRRVTTTAGQIRNQLVTGLWPGWLRLAAHPGTTPHLAIIKQDWMRFILVDNAVAARRKAPP